MSCLYHNRFLKCSNFYRRNLLPKLRSLRGFTKPMILLRELGIKQISRRVDGHYKVSITSGKSRNFSDIELVDKYTGIEYAQCLLILDEIKQDTVFYDIGGFQGFHTILGSLGKKVYTFEPDPQNLEKLRKNVELNSNQDIEIVEKPVWNKVEELELDVGKEGKSSVGKGELKKESVTLDSFVFEENYEAPDFIKIDVEGAEQKVLEGAEKVLKEHKPKIMVEIHSESSLDKFDSSVGEITDILESKGYRLDTEITRMDETHKLFIAEE